MKRKTMTRQVYDLCFKWVGAHHAAVLETRLMAIFSRELSRVRKAMRCCGNCGRKGTHVCDTCNTETYDGWKAVR